MPKMHELKTWPEYFDAIVKGEKLFEIRKNDRDFQVGDYLRLCEYDPELQRFTGDYIKKRVSYMVQGVFDLPDDMCVMSLAPSGFGYTDTVSNPTPRSPGRAFR